MAGKKIRGITVEIGGDVSGLNKALENTNKKVRDTQSQLKDVQRLLKLDPTNTELLKQKQQLLAQAVGETKGKLDTLRKVEQQLKDSGVDENSAQFMAVRREIVSTTEEMERLEAAAGETSSAMDRIGDVANRVADGAQTVADKTAGLSKAAGDLLDKVGAVAIKAVGAYSDKEQLIGGVETLFKRSAGTVVSYAENAYKTAGLSANDYLETVTGFSASLISSLGGDTSKAAYVADRAITDMADNANKMGTDIASIQNAYQGFAKGQYNMLDNLKLGYGGTKTEMERLLRDAERLAGLDEGSLSVDSFSDIVTAIHAVQVELGIAGATAAEAESTIEGSTNAFKASIENWLAGMGDANADVYELTENVIDSFMTMADNILPVIQTIWDHLPGGAKFAIGALGVAAAISPIAGGISNVASSVSSATDLATKLGPVLSKAGTGLASLFGSIGSFIAANPIVLIAAAIIALVALIATKGDEIKALLQKVDDFFQNIFATDFTKIFGPVLGEALNGFFANIKNIWDSIKRIFDGIIDFIKGVFSGDWERAWEGIKNIFGGIFDSLKAAAKTPINGIITILNAAISGINKLIQGINKIKIDIPSWVPLLGGKTFGFNIREIGKIPYLANGGILERGSAIVGEAGPELLTMSGGGAVVQPLTNQTTHHKSTYLGGMTVNVYAAAGQDAEEIADAVMEKAQQKYEEEAIALA